MLTVQGMGRFAKLALFLNMGELRLTRLVVLKICLMILIFLGIKIDFVPVAWIITKACVKAMQENYKNGRKILRTNLLKARVMLLILKQTLNLILNLIFLLAT